MARDNHKERRTAARAEANAHHAETLTYYRLSRKPNRTEKEQSILNQAIKDTISFFGDTRQTGYDEVPMDTFLRLKKVAINEPRDERKERIARQIVEREKKQREESKKRREKAKEQRRALKLGRRAGPAADAAGLRVEEAKKKYQYKTLIRPLRMENYTRLIHPSAFSDEEADVMIDILKRATEVANVPLNEYGSAVRLSKEEIDRRDAEYRGLEKEYLAALKKYRPRSSLEHFIEETKRGDAFLDTTGASDYFMNKRAHNQYTMMLAARARGYTALENALNENGADFAEFLLSKKFNWESFYEDKYGRNISKADAETKIRRIARKYRKNKRFGKVFQKLLDEMKKGDDR